MKLEGSMQEEPRRSCKREVVLGKTVTRSHDPKPKPGLPMPLASLSTENAVGFRPPSSTTEVNLLISFCFSG